MCCMFVVVIFCKVVRLLFMWVGLLLISVVWFSVKVSFIGVCCCLSWVVSSWVFILVSFVLGIGWVVSWLIFVCSCFFVLFGVCLLVRMV